MTPVKQDNSSSSSSSNGATTLGGFWPALQNKIITSCNLQQNVPFESKFILKKAVIHNTKHENYQLPKSKLSHRTLAHWYTFNLSTSGNNFILQNNF